MSVYSGYAKANHKQILSGWSTCKKRLRDRQVEDAWSVAFAESAMVHPEFVDVLGRVVLLSRREEE